MYTKEEKIRLVLRKMGGNLQRSSLYGRHQVFREESFWSAEKEIAGIIVFAKEDHKVGDLFIQTKPLLRSTQPSRTMEITLGLKQNSTSKPGSSV